MRQSNTPIPFDRTTRRDEAVTMTSGRAGTVLPVGYIPLLRGDTASGRVSISLDLAEMPKPVLNGVIYRAQAWFVPKSAHPQFAGYDEFSASYNGTQIQALGQPDRDAPPFFVNKGWQPLTDMEAEDSIYRKLGLHCVANTVDATRTTDTNSDLADAYALIHNFRRASHSSRLPLTSYFSETGGVGDAALKVLPAFWPSGRFASVVPDYERALVVGSLDLDVTAGQLPLSIGIPAVSGSTELTAKDGAGDPRKMYTDGGALHMGSIDASAEALFADMQGQKVGITLADLDKARETQAFANMRAAYAGNDSTGYNDDEAILADLMRGITVPPEHFNRPWLLDNQQGLFGMVERNATDGASLDQSVTTGQAVASLSVKVPKQDVGGVILITVEVMPEQIHERQGDPWLHVVNTGDLPDALRDIQIVEPVDIKPNWQIDARHTNPLEVYGYEPLNTKWQRVTTRLGGEFYQADPANPFLEARSAVWQANVVDPVLSEDQYMCPSPFPHNVFSDTLADAFEVVARHSVAINGLTQFGDVLVEANDDYAAVQAAGE